MSCAILWFRNDLRLGDHPALRAVLDRAPDQILFVYIWEPSEAAPWEPGAASRVWLHHSLLALSQSIEKKGGRLLLRRGPSLSTLRNLAQEHGASYVAWTRCYEPALVLRDTAIKASLESERLTVETFNGSLIAEPWEVKTTTGGPYQVYTPFSRAVFKLRERRDVLPEPRILPPAPREATSLQLEELKLLPRISWHREIEASWTPGEAGARRNLTEFVRNAVSDYEATRNFPALESGTSRLSPHLRFGEISPNMVRARVEEALREPNVGHSLGYEVFLKEIVWREFAYHLLFHFPQTTTKPLRPKFERFPWKDDPERLKLWQKGETGYPIVDAGMRQLWRTGWMHNRVRMIVASFLVKDLLVSWQDGARWFWDTLVDADLASNTLGWQWTAGCGADAAPYFRVFNPITQGEKFDPSGDYIRRWVPELSKLTSHVHHPWKSSVYTGGYPQQIVDHSEARDEALEAFARL
ncbi:MAG: deoxyribodipyrimidine photo-lyase [Deltaproteobacteria bacterium]|nr:deoxyribodipyrimidine photo-lyase [Deltaproteobacteria bacterium]